MGLFDHLFKSRPDDSVERVVEAPLKASGLVRIAKGEGEAPPDPAAAFLQPKGYAPGAANPSLGGQNQGFVPVLPAAKRAPAHERKLAPVEGASAPPDLVVLTVGDVLGRIPASFLSLGPHDLKRELRFQIADLSSDITRGRPMIALSCIAEQCPELFHTPIRDEDDIAIRLPLQKLVEQVGRLGPRNPVIPQPIVHHPAARAPVTPPVEKAASEPPVRVAPPPPQPPVAPAPPPIAKEIVSPILPPVAPPPLAASQVVAAPVEAAPIETPSLAPAPVPLEPVPEVIAPKAPEPLPVPQPEPAAEIATVTSKEPSPEPVPSPSLFHATETPDESTIELSFAALVAGVPRELFAGPPPRIAENYRINLPFPMIERQLGSGVVEIPGRLFWSAIPPLLKHHFVHREDISISIPLEEIFQNLPVGGQDENRRIESMLAPAPRPADLENPIVLAPAPVAAEEPALDLELPLTPVAPIPEPEPVRPPEPVATSIVEPASAPPSVVIPEAAVAPSEAPVLAATLAAETAPVSAASAAPADTESFVIQLQPFRAFSPPSPAVEPETVPAASSGETVVLEGTSGAPPPATEPAKLLVPADDHPLVGPEQIPASQTTEPPEAMAPAASLEDQTPPTETPLASPAPETVPIVPPKPEPLEAFNPDQPPPLKIEEPAAAVAILRATVPSPQETPVSAAATVSVQPPKIFRPTVLAPPISGYIANTPVNLAPTLAGSAAIASGMISLAPAPESNPPTSPPPVSLPAAQPDPAPKPAASDEPVDPPAEKPSESRAVRAAAAPTLKNFVRQIFHVPPTNPAPDAAATTAPETPASPPPLAEPPASSPEPPRSSPEPAPFQLHLPPLPAPVAAPPAPEHAPPALPISRFDQHSLQSLFMTDETLDLPKVSRLAAALPGLQACVITTRGKTFASGDLPEGFDVGTLRGLSPQVGAAADRLTIGELKNFTLYGQQYSISFFERPSVCLCAIHRARCFIPGVREKLVAVVDELARG